MSKKTMRKRIMAWALSLCMAAGCVSAPVSAVSTGQVVGSMQINQLLGSSLTGTQSTGTQTTGTQSTGTQTTGTQTTGTQSTGTESTEAVSVPCAETDCGGTYENGFCPVCDSYQAATENSGVYEIGNAGQLYWFAQKVNNGDTSINGKLTANITVNESVLKTDGSLNGDGSNFRAWTPIGNSFKQYTGTFDGNGKTISGLYFSAEQDYVGLFGYVGKGTVKNVGIVNSYFYGESEVGAVVGRVQTGTIENCYNTGTVSATENGKHIGGVVGYFWLGRSETGGVKSCYNTGVVAGYGYVGGVVGRLYLLDGAKLTIENCYNSGEVSGYEDVGGIIGEIDTSITWDKYYNSNLRTKPNITSCYSTGKISGTKYVGGGVGEINRYATTTFTNCYYLTGTASTSVGYGYGDIHGSVEEASYTSFASGAVAYLLNGQKASGAWYQYGAMPALSGCAVTADGKVSHTFDNGFCMACGAYQAPEGQGGAADDPYLVKNAGNLYWLAQIANNGSDLKNKYISLGADIVVNPGTFAADGTYTAKNGESVRAWTPFALTGNHVDGAKYDETGKLVGNYTISGLYFKDEDVENVGLFSTVDADSTVAHIGIVNSYLYGCSEVGALAGYNYGTVECCYNSGVVSGLSANIGGVVGFNRGEVRNCYNTGNIDRDANSVGGVVGMNGGVVTNCYNIGKVSSENKGYIRPVGGVVGLCDADGTVADCYCLTDYADDLVGYYSDRATITNVEFKSAAAFASGEVAYLLNGSRSVGTEESPLVWYQSGDLPGFFGHTATYDDNAYAAGHTYENGFCTVCGDYEAPTLKNGYYEIDNAGKLYWFAAKVNSGSTDIKGKLTANIVVNPGTFDTSGNYTAKNGEKPRQWTPIGSNANEYKGTFDGGIYDDSGKKTGNYTISGLYVNSTEDCIGLFGCIYDGAEVKNVAVQDSFIYSSKSDVGGVAGENSGTVTGCSYSGTVSGESRVGGVVGTTYGKVTNCYNTGTVIGNGNSIGGVVGSNGREVTNCYNTGKVINNSESIGTGGVVGRVSGVVTNCYSLNTSADKAIGSDYGTVTNVEAVTAAQFASGEVAYKLNNGASPAVWYQQGDLPGFSGDAVTYDETKETYTIVHTYENGFCTVCGCYQPCEGSGTEESPYLIGNAGQLYWFAQQVNGGSKGIWGKLTANITVNPGEFDASGNYTPGEGEAAGTKPRLWTPIGHRNSIYNGTFDGAGHSISGLYYNDSTTDYVGLFGCVGGTTVGESAESKTAIRGITLKNSYICGKDYVGGIAGDVQYDGNKVKTTISECMVQSDVTVQGAYYVGGVVGCNYGTVTLCGSSATVTGETDVGGVVGNSNNVVSDCYNVGTVRAERYGVPYAGGVVGYTSSSGTVTNCYYLAGCATKTDLNSGDTTPCYGIGGTSADDESKTQAMEKADFASGAVAYKLNGSVGGGFWKQTLEGENKQALPGFTGDDVYYGYLTCADETPKYTRDPEARAEKIEHDYQNGICQQLAGETHYQPCSGEGTAEKPYLIANAGNLYWFAQLVNGGKNTICGKLTANIVVNPGKFDASGNYTPGTDEPADTTPRVWTPMGNEKNCYEGTFDGAGFAISGLYVNSTDNCVGLFGYANESTVKNVGVTGGYIHGNWYVGGVIGRNYIKGEVTNCYNTGWVSGSLCVGGVVGNNNGTVKNCYNTGTVSGESGVGGVAGQNQWAYATVENCWNTGTVTGQSNVGGVVGFIDCGNAVTNCYNTGTVTGTGDYIGGVIGFIFSDNMVTVTNCYNTGAVSGSTDVGGVVGYIYRDGTATATVENCYYLSGTASTGIGYGEGTATAMTASDFASGKVAWLLNGQRSVGTDESPLVWFQKLGEEGDSTPNFVGGDDRTVYSGYAGDNCSASAPRLYSNESYALSETIPAHQSYNRIYTSNGNGTHSVKCPVCEETIIAAEDCTIAPNGNCKYCGTPGCAHVDTNADGFCDTCGVAIDKPEQDSEGYYLIENVAQLYWFAQHVNSGNTGVGAKLMNNIVVNPGTFNSKGEYTAKNGETLRVWTPICDTTDLWTSYSADFDGNGYTVSGLYCKVENGNAGFFGKLGYYAVKNLHIANSYFEGDQAGAIAGYGEARLEKCSAGADVTVVGSTYTGGLVGNANGGSVKNCYSLAAVSGGVWGGLTGHNGAEISNSFTTAMQPVGINRSGYGSMSNVFYGKDTRDYETPDEEGFVIVKPTFEGATEVVDEKDFTSGKIAWLLQNGVTGELEGYDGDNNPIYGPAPEIWGQTIGTDGYPNFTGQKVYKKINDGCPMAKDQFSNTEGEHFTGTHTTFDADGFCACGNAYQPCEGEGTAAKPYIIKNAGNLYWFAQQVNSGATAICGKLAANITVNPGTFDENGNYTAKNGETLRQWTPIGSANAYKGTFDGTKYDDSGKKTGNYTISGLYVNSTGESVGLFGYVGTNGTVKNVTVKDSYISGDYYVGGVVGSNSGTVMGCVNSGTVIGTGEHIGGVVGYNSGGTITNCTNSGTVTGKTYVGGVVGNNRGTVENCTNSGTVTGTGQYTGGVVGNNRQVGTVENCTNSGTVTGTGQYTGGVVGVNRDDGTVKNCTNSGAVNGTSQVGGVVSWNNGGTVTKCSSTGTVTGTGDYIGGVVGLNKGTVTGCANSGSVTGTYDVGGIVGYNEGKVENCTNSGTVTGTSNYIGGVAGRNTKSGEITACSNTAQVTGNSIVGGVVGWNYGTLTSSFSTGTVTGTGNYIGGVVGVNERGTVTNCYYLNTSADNAIGTDNGTSTDVEAKTEADFASGAVTWLLNGEKGGDDAVWKQKLGENGSPLPNFTDEVTVYFGYRTCMDEEPVYTNSPSVSSTKIEHNYDNGFCTGGHYEPCSGAGTAESPYIIKNAGNLFWFAEKVAGGETGACAVVMDQIDLENRPWTPIGTESAPYTGTFDGGDCLIDNLSITATANNQGLFGVVSGATVKNFTLSGQIDIAANVYNVGSAVGYAQNGARIEGIDSYVAITDTRTNATGTIGYVGGLVGKLDGSTVTKCVNRGKISMANSAVERIGGIAGTAGDSAKAYITYCDNYGAITAGGNSVHIGGIAGGATNGGVDAAYCINYGNVTSGGSNCIGGVVGYAKENTNITYCGNVGTVTSTNATGAYIGGILGYVRVGSFGSLKNCFNYGNIVSNEGNDNHAGAIVGWQRIEEAKFTNNAYLSTSCASATGGNGAGATAYSEAQFASGEVAYKLNGGSDSWKQTIGKDGYPNFTGGTVYFYTDCGEIHRYTNTETENGSHYYENGFCANGCSAYEPCAGDGTADSPYLIANAGNLYWFAAQVNGGNAGIHGKVTADITVNKGVLKEDGTLNGDGSNFRVWTPIGNNDKSYTGTFDGDGHTISGLYYNGSDNCIALIGVTDGNVVIRNVGVIDNYFYTSNASAGGILASEKSGSSVTVLGCFNAGTVMANKFTGGVVGYISYGVSATISNCYNTGTITAKKINNNPNAGGIVGTCYHSTVTITNCYNTGTITAENQAIHDCCAGGIIGCDSESRSQMTVINCYNTGTISAIGTKYIFAGSLGGFVTNISFKNCYYLNGSAPDIVGKGSTGVLTTVGMTAADFASGKVAYLLNGSKDGEDVVWKQTLETDATPNFTGLIVHYDKDLDYYYNGESVPEVVSVNISWSAMEFTFEDGGWQPESHTYGEGKWTTTGGTVTVENVGTVAVTATFAYRPDAGYEGITGSFSGYTNGTAFKRKERITAKLTLSGQPEGELDNAHLGDIVITITKASS